MEQGIGMLEAQKEGLHSWNRRVTGSGTCSEFPEI